MLCCLPCCVAPRVLSPPPFMRVFGDDLPQLVVLFRGKGAPVPELLHHRFHKVAFPGGEELAVAGVGCRGGRRRAGRTHVVNGAAHVRRFRKDLRVFLGKVAKLFLLLGRKRRVSAELICNAGEELVFPVVEERVLRGLRQRGAGRVACPAAGPRPKLVADSAEHRVFGDRRCNFQWGAFCGFFLIMCARRPFAFGNRD